MVFELEAPNLELKPSRNHLECMFWGHNETLPVIEGRLIHLGWTIANIKGLIPSLCMHQILMEENPNLLKMHNKD
ncbi:Retrovirus-related Pol polyprotein from transposon 412 family [Gossypium australe]|uniref:Retrovirus-related Pol polyprotein from transposon 412 family n=1 Tax=Gossypium australe TaxID=47621 RepID=A0A5B6WTR9_9ROSI|nr:Retrovirus-related Pol polyprotein from transposon 412 family [Gossypium australe]